MPGADGRRVSSGFRSGEEDSRSVDLGANGFRRAELFDDASEDLADVRHGPRVGFWGKPLSPSYRPLEADGLVTAVRGRGMKVKLSEESFGRLSRCKWRTFQTGPDSRVPRYLDELVSR